MGFSRRNFFGAIGAIVVPYEPKVIYSIPKLANSVYSLDDVSAYPLELILKISLSSMYGKIGGEWQEKPITKL